MKIMYRQVQEYREGVWGRMLDLEHRADQAESAAGHPLPSRMRAFAAGGLHSQTRVQERAFDDVLAWARHLEDHARHPDLLRIDAERDDLLNWQRDELYYVDESGGDPPPVTLLIDQLVNARRAEAASTLERLLAATGETPVTVPPYVAPPTEASDETPQAPPAPPAPLRLMYRQIQRIRPGMWEEQYALERKTDEVESSAGHPVPNRYRVLAASGLDTQLRVHQRVYPSIAAWGRLFEEWTQHDEMQAIEVERKRFYSWEREELYYVDVRGEQPIRWIQLMAEDERARHATPQSHLAELARQLDQ